MRQRTIDGVDPLVPAEVILDAASDAAGIWRRLPSTREELLAKAGADIRREKLKKEMQYEREKDKIIDQTQKRDREVGGVQCVQGQESGRRPQPHGPTPMSQGEPEQAQILPSQAPKPKQANHCGEPNLKVEHRFGDCGS